VTIRYDPRDITEIRVFHHNRFLCRAISPDHAGQTISLKDIQVARAAHRRALRGQINERIARITDFLPAPTRDQAPPPPAPAQRRTAPRLRTYLEDTR
jgi:putative transposase